jgi:dTDP-4-dehydrorhamnose 3,5-epimerase-like enzyme
MQSKIISVNDLLVELPTFTHKEGKLILAEVRKVSSGLFLSAPRVYWIVNDTEKEIERGGHYHPKGGKKEIMICLSGKANIELHAQAFCTHVTLDSPKLGLLIPNMLWHKVLMFPGAILLCIASTEYNQEECSTALPCNDPSHQRD